MTYRRVAHVAWRRLGPETVVLDLRSKRVYALNESGGALWHALVDHGAAVAARRPGEEEFLAELVRLGIAAAAEPAAEAGETARYAVSAVHAEPPRVIWQDDIRSFGISCLQTPIQGGCQARPTT